MYTEVKNPVWANAEQTIIDVEVNFKHLPEEFVPFSTSQDADTEYGKQIFADALAGEYGSIGAYVAPPPPTVEQLAINVRAERDVLLMTTDWTQLPDVPQATKDLYAAYRQELRDITLQAGFPTDVIWPEMPA